MTTDDEIPVREAAKPQPAPTTLPIERTAAAPALVATTRVWSLTGCGHTDEVMGVRFDKHYVDVDADTAAKLVARKQEHIIEKPDGTEETELLDLYSTTEPAHLKAKA